MLLIVGILFCGDSMVSGQPSIGFRTIPLAEDDASTDVIALTDLNFDRLVNGSSDWMIDLYSEWYEWYIHVLYYGISSSSSSSSSCCCVGRLHCAPICMYSRFSS